VAVKNEGVQAELLREAKHPGKNFDRGFGAVGLSPHHPLLRFHNVRKRR
jgi:hypothetical protein